MIDFKFLFICMCVPVCLYVYLVSAGAHGSQKKVLEPLRNGSYRQLRADTWVLEMESMFSARTASALN